MKRRVMPAATARLLMGDEPPARKPRKARAPRPSEAAVVIAIKARLALYGCLVLANPNEAGSAARGGGWHIRNTMLGFPDLTIIGPCGRTAFLEVKAPGAKPKPSNLAHWQRQAEVRETLARMGHVTGLVRSQDEACDLLRGAGWKL
jgi:hypothetical protein